MKQTAKKYILPYLWITLASLVYAVGFNWCFVPNQIGFGGITGVGQIVNHLLPWAPIGTVVIVCNIPLFLLGWRLLGGHLLVSSLYAMFISSLFIDLLTALYAFPPMEEPLLACIFGGVLAGVGLGFVFMRGGTTGGTDLVAKLVSTHVKFISLGRLVLLADCVVILMTFIVYQNLSSPLYALIFLFVHSKVIDAVLYGVDSGRGKMMLIISPKNQEIKDYILTEVSRGVTELMSRGGYSGIEGEVLLVAVRRQEVYRTYDVIKRVDPKAFVIVANADQISGLGFREKDDV